MKIYIYKGGLSLVAKSGVGSAIRHQEKMLRAAKVTVTDVWKEADIVHINTVLPDSPLVARRARRQGKKVVYYFIVSRTNGSGEASAACNSGT